MTTPGAHLTMFHRHVPNVSKAYIFGSPLHVKIPRATRHRPDPNTLLGTFVGFQGTSHIYQYIGDTGRVQYATHAVIDELCLHWLPSERSPAAQILFGSESKTGSEADHANALCQEISDLEPGLPPWLPDDQRILEVGDLLPDEHHGIIVQYHANHN